MYAAWLIPTAKLLSKYGITTKSYDEELGIQFFGADKTVRGNVEDYDDSDIYDMFAKKYDTALLKLKTNLTQKYIVSLLEEEYSDVIISKVIK